jgi:hypothetical protein
VQARRTGSGRNLRTFLFSTFSQPFLQPVEQSVEKWGKGGSGTGRRVLQLDITPVIVHSALLV